MGLRTLLDIPDGVPPRSRDRAVERLTRIDRQRIAHDAAHPPLTSRLSIGASVPGLTPINRYAPCVLSRLDRFRGVRLVDEVRCRCRCVSRSTGELRC